VLDFFCSDAKLAIEVDGIAHDMGDNPMKDQVRDAWLEARGVTTLRLRAGDISRSADQAVEWIVAACVERCNPLHQPAAGPPPRFGEESP
jgi:very-short-patch-repair endonuclease